jgi:DnaJ-class molecular chaperone
VICKAEQVVTCPVCKGEGKDQFASLVAGVKEMSGEANGGVTTDSVTTVMVDDWDSGPKAVVMYGDILARYPIKVDRDICVNCDGRGVTVCNNCEGTGLQPRFLERYSPDDFMD